MSEHENTVLSVLAYHFITRLGLKYEEDALAVNPSGCALNPRDQQWLLGYLHGCAGSAPDESAKSALSKGYNTAVVAAAMRMAADLPKFVWRKTSQKTPGSVLSSLKLKSGEWSLRRNAIELIQMIHKGCKPNVSSCLLPRDKLRAHPSFPALPNWKKYRGTITDTEILHLKKTWAENIEEYNELIKETGPLRVEWITQLRTLVKPVRKAVSDLSNFRASKLFPEGKRYNAFRKLDLKGKLNSTILPFRTIIDVMNPKHYSGLKCDLHWRESDSELDAKQAAAKFEVKLQNCFNSNEPVLIDWANLVLEQFALRSFEYTRIGDGAEEEH
jgi:hypothetical protein